MRKGCWTPTRAHIARYHGVRSIARLAADLGIREDSVHKAVRRYELNRGPNGWTTTAWRIVRQCRALGMTYADTAIYLEHCGLYRTPAAIKAFCYRQGRDAGK